MFDGILSQDLPELDPGAEGKHDVGIMFLAAGQYGFRVRVEYTAKDADEVDRRTRLSDICRVTVA